MGKKRTDDEYIDGLRRHLMKWRRHTSVMLIVAVIILAAGFAGYLYSALKYDEFRERATRGGIRLVEPDFMEFTYLLGRRVGYSLGGLVIPPVVLLAIVAWCWDRPPRRITLLVRYAEKLDATRLLPDEDGAIIEPEVGSERAHAPEMKADWNLFKRRSDRQYVERIRRGRARRYLIALILILPGVLALSASFRSQMHSVTTFRSLANKSKFTGDKLKNADLMDSRYKSGQRAGFGVATILVVGTWMIMTSLILLFGSRTSRLLIKYADQLEAACLLPHEPDRSVG